MVVDDIKLIEMVDYCNVNIKNFSEFPAFRYIEIFNIRIVTTPYLNRLRIIVCSDGNQYQLPICQYDKLDRLEKMGKQARIIYLDKMTKQYIKFNCTYYSDYKDFVQENYWDIDLLLDFFIKRQPKNISHQFSNIIECMFEGKCDCSDWFHKALLNCYGYKYLDSIQIEIVFNYLNEVKKPYSRTNPNFLKEKCQKKRTW